MQSAYQLGLRLPAGPGDGMSIWAGLNPPYSTIVIDPPWPYGVGPHKSREGYKGKSLPYSSMTLPEIRALPVAELGTDVRVYLWITNRYLRYGWDILESWGFEVADRTFVWCKKPRCTTPVTTEYILVGKRGKPARLPWHPTTHFHWPLQSAHSQKPAAFMDLVEQWSEPPYLELFARSPRLGWDSWGMGWEGIIRHR